MTWQTFGFENIKKYFERAVADDSLEHAYLFSGQEMIGKKSFALELASYFGPRANNPDLLMLGEENIGIDQVRNLKNFLMLKPYAGKHKIAILNDAHQIGAEAANAMLKVLEEPPEHSLIILI